MSEPRTRTHTHEEAFQASPERLFRLLITPSEIRGWWNASCAIVVPRKDGTWVAAWGAQEDAPDYVTGATIRAYEPPRRLLLGIDAQRDPLPFEASFEVEFTIVPQGDSSTLRVVHSGFPDGPEADDFFAGCRRGWVDTFAGIRERLAAGDAAVPDEADAAFARLVDDVAHECRRHRWLVEQALGRLDDAQFMRPPVDGLNAIAVIVKHLAGSMRSRWTDFGAGDGERADRDRDAEFTLGPDDTRESLMARWSAAWQSFEGALAVLAGDSARWRRATVTIRGEPHTTSQALARGAGHIAYHAGQILMLARWVNPDSPWLTIAPGASAVAKGTYRAQPGR